MDHMAAGAPEFVRQPGECWRACWQSWCSPRAITTPHCPDRRSEPDQRRRGGDAPASETAGLDWG